jgi:YHS domain-containing protein
MWKARTKVQPMAILGNAPKKARQEKDPVCGMMVVVDLAVGPEASPDGDVWFCSLGCQAQFQEEQEKKSRGAEGDRWTAPTGVEA